MRCVACYGGSTRADGVCVACRRKLVCWRNRLAGLRDDLLLLGRVRTGEDQPRVSGDTRLSPPAPMPDEVGSFRADAEVWCRIDPWRLDASRVPLALHWMEQLIGRGMRLMDVPVWRSIIPNLAAHAGMPLLEGEERELWTCPGVVSARIPAVTGERALLKCGQCGARWLVTDLPQSWRFRVWPSQAAQLVGVHISTVHRWIKKGLLPVRSDGLVRIDHLLKAAA